MNGWDALQAYDLVNDGGGNYGFRAPKQDGGLYLREGWLTMRLAKQKLREAKRLERLEQGLDKP